MVDHSLKLPREIYRVPSLWPQVFTLNNYRILIEDKGFLRRHPQQPHRRRTRDAHLGVHLVLRRLLDGALPLPLPRAHRPPDPVRLSDADLAAVHPAVDHDGAAAARQLAARSDPRLPDLLAAAQHLAAAGLLPRRPARTRGAGHDRRPEPPRRAVPHRAAALGAGPRRGRDLHLHRRLERAAAGAGADHLGIAAHRAARRSTT